jgi:hypothetical protein
MFSFIMTDDGGGGGGGGSSSSSSSSSSTGDKDPVLPPYTYSDTSCGIPFTEATLIANA